MYTDFLYKVIDLAPSKELLDFDFNLITLDDWTKNPGLRLKLPFIFGEVYTFSILYFAMEKWGDPLNNSPEPRNTDHPIFNLIMDEVRKLEQFYNATAKIVVLDGIPPGGEIPLHVDKGTVSDLGHRVHLPLTTASGVTFTIGDETLHFEAGKYFEFNNKIPHGVKNDSDIFRIHMVLDLVPNN